MDRDRRGDPGLLDRMAWSGATAGATSATPTGSIGPGRSARPARELAIVFRDHSMSDQVGFHYQRSPGPVAAADFLGKVHAIARRLPARPGHAGPGDPRRRELLGILPRRRRLVPPLALPGRRARPEDPPGPGRRVPRRAPAASATPCRASSPGAGSATTSPSGSAIPRTTAAGTALHAAREFLVGEDRSGRHDAAALAKAWEEIYIAEGSDWFWWFGDDHSSAQDALFDHLFRKHLRNVYTLLGCDPPGSLFTPICAGAAHRPLHDQPVSFLRVKVDGRATVLRVDRRGAVCLRQRPRHHDAGRPRAAASGLVRLRRRAAADPRRHRGRAGARAAGRGRPAPHRLRRPGRPRDPGDGARLGRDRSRTSIDPAARPATATRSRSRPAPSWSWPSRSPGSTAAPGDPIRFYVELFQGDSSLDRAPREGVFELTTPSRRISSRSSGKFRRTPVPREETEPCPT